ncbi:MAG: pyridoxal phosphate-dependent aminotransferase [Vicinamibacterales bacterium]
MFSSRLPANPVANALSRRLAALRASGETWVDLTESNPTRAGLAYPRDLLAPLADPSSLVYEPHPLGLPAAREAVALDQMRRGARVDPAQVVLAASTSEAYGWLFKLLCNPGDQVLVPRPSYPLVEHLSRLDAIEAVPYDLEYHGRWEIDVEGLAARATAATRAVLLVSPNNPTGSYVKAAELRRLSAFCVERGLALVADEVFADYRLEAPADVVTDIAAGAAPLAFTLGGLSKSVGLPQLKLGWIIVGGEAKVRRDALHALELVADSYLSVSTPVQVAAADLLARGAAIREGIVERVRGNLAALDRIASRFQAVTVLACEGGWYAVVRVPSTRAEEALVLALLDRERVLVHPGYFFDFPREAYLIVSLLPRPAVFADATARMLQFVAAAAAATSL